MQTNQMTALNQVIQIADYQPHKRNYNRHPALQVQRIAASLQMFGQVRSVVVWRNFFLAGHGVREGALKLGWTELRADVLPDDYPEELALAYVAADNELGRLSDPDNAQLAQILEESRQYDAELLAAIGYDDAEFDALLKEVERDAVKAEPSDGEPQIDRAAELLAKWQVQPGDLWRIGEHRLACGDCTDPATVARVMDGEKAQSIVTDPPYGTASKGKVQKRGQEIRTFDIEWDRTAPLDWIPLLSDCLDGGSAIACFWDNKEITTLWNALEENGFNPLQTVYWKKTTVPQPRQNFCSSIESAVFARRPGKVLCWNGGGATPNVFDANRAAGNERAAHETQKPLTLFSWLIELISDSGFLLYEPFAGSGTTLVACQNLSRRCRAIEISPAYCAVILQRMTDAFPTLPIERVADG